MFTSHMVQNTGRNVDMCRWYQLREVMQDLVREWTCLLAPITLLAVTEGMLEGSTNDALQKKKPAPPMP